MTTKKIKVILSRETSHEVIGIINTHQRLIKAFGKGLTIESQLNIGTGFSFRIPKEHI